MGTPVCLPLLNNTQLPTICLAVILPTGADAELYCLLRHSRKLLFAWNIIAKTHATGDEFSQSLSTANTTVTTAQSLSWNPDFIGLCSNTTEKIVYSGAFGGMYIVACVANFISSVSFQQRGGGDVNLASITFLSTQAQLFCLLALS